MGRDFDEEAWVACLAAALERVAANARPHDSPLPYDPPRYGPIKEFESILHGGISRPRGEGEIRSGGGHPIQ